jgi:ribonuclease P protein component
LFFAVATADNLADMTPSLPSQPSPKSAEPDSKLAGAFAQAAGAGRPPAWLLCRLRKHADYQRVYKASRKNFGKQMSYFFALRPPIGPDGTSVRHAAPDAPRVGLTVGKVLGKAVDRNRIKRRLREAVRHQLPLLASPVDLILHPRRSVLDLDFATIEREIATIFRTVQKATENQRARTRSSAYAKENQTTD